MEKLGILEIQLLPTTKLKLNHFSGRCNGSRSKIFNNDVLLLKEIHFWLFSLSIVCVIHVSMP
jgi:hypothetical protein